MRHEPWKMRTLRLEAEVDCDGSSVRAKVLVKYVVWFGAMAVMQKLLGVWPILIFSQRLLLRKELVTESGLDRAIASSLDIVDNTELDELVGSVP